MIEIQADLHTHSDLSDGKGTLEENVEAAYRQGLGCIACTEHGPRHMKAGISMRQLSELRRRVDRLNQQYQGKLTVLMGLESNLISLEGELDVPEAYREYFDILLMGFHLSARPTTLSECWMFQSANPRAEQRYSERYRQKATEAYLRAIEKNRFDILVHPGLHWPLEYQKIAEACQAYGVAMEISARPKHLIFNEKQTRQMAETGVQFVIDSDGHKPEEIGRVQSAIDFAERAGLGLEQILNAKGRELPAFRRG